MPKKLLAFTVFLVILLSVPISVLALDFKAIAPKALPLNLEPASTSEDFVSPLLRTDIIKIEDEEPDFTSDEDARRPDSEEEEALFLPELNAGISAEAEKAEEPAEETGDYFPDREEPALKEAKDIVQPKPAASPQSPPANNPIDVSVPEEKSSVENPADWQKIEVRKPAIAQKVQPEEPGLAIGAISLDVGAELDVCDLSEGCSGDIGKTHWLKSATIFGDNTERYLRYFSKGNQVKEGILQASFFSFADNDNPAIVYSRGIDAGEFLFDFNLLSGAESLEFEYPVLQSENPGASAAFSDGQALAVQKQDGFWGKLFFKIKNIFQAPFRLVKNVFLKPAVKLAENKPGLKKSLGNLRFNTFYLRVLPTVNGQVAGRASSEIKVVLSPPAESEEVVFYTPAKIYEVKIKDFQPIRAPEPGVCTGAMILDNDWTIPGANGPVLYKKAGSRVCPDTYQGVGEQAWYESFWDFAKSGVDWVSQAYTDLKTAVVDGVAGLACGGDEFCRSLVSQGLDIGMAAMGLPPSLPNFDQLLDDGFDYLAAEIAAQAGCSSTDCRELIKENLKNALDGSEDGNPACGDVEAAHRMGIEPLCLPEGVKAHIDPRGTFRNASAVLELKRNHEPGGPVGGGSYKLYFNNAAVNSAAVGSWIHNIEPYGESVQITEPLKGQVFLSKNIIIPELEKGQSVDIPINLIPAEYWVPGHLEAMHGWTTVTYKDGIPQRNYDDWWKLYYGGTLTLGAAIDGCEYSYGNESCIVSTDSLTVDLPNTINP